MTDPAAMQNISVDYEIAADNTLVVEIQFNKVVDITSMEARVNVQVIGETDPNVPIQIAAKSGRPNSAVITTDVEYFAFCEFDSDCFFEFGDAWIWEQPRQCSRWVGP